MLDIYVYRFYQNEIGRRANFLGIFSKLKSTFISTTKYVYIVKNNRFFMFLVNFCKTKNVAYKYFIIPY